MSTKEKGFVDGFLDGFRSIWPWRSKNDEEDVKKEGTLPSKTQDSQESKSISENEHIQKNLDELRRRQKLEYDQENTARKARQKLEKDKQVIEENKKTFRVKCKRMGWLCSIVLLLAWLSLTFYDYIWGKEFRFVECLVFFWKWILGVGVVSYGFLNMITTFEHYLTQWVREHRNDFLNGTNLGWRAAWNFWKYMMGDTMFFGCGKVLFPVLHPKLWKKLFIGEHGKGPRKRTAKSTDVGF